MLAALPRCRVRKQEESKETRPRLSIRFSVAKISLLNFHLAVYKRVVKIKWVVNERAKRCVCVCVCAYVPSVCMCMCRGKANGKILMPSLYAVSAEYFIKSGEGGEQCARVCLKINSGKARGRVSPVSPVRSEVDSIHLKSLSILHSTFVINNVID